MRPAAPRDRRRRQLHALPVRILGHRRRFTLNTSAIAQPLDLTASNASAAAPVTNAPSQPSTSGMSQPRRVSPEQLSEDPRPVKRLRRDRASSDTAKELLREIGYVATKGKSSSDRASEVPWPEDYIDRLEGSEPTYESLTLSEFVAGYLSILEEDLPSNVDCANVRRHVHYLRGLMEDCFETEWTVVRTAHKQVLNAIEHGRIKWGNFNACLTIKATAIQRVLRIQQLEPIPKVASAEPPLNPCPLFQSLNCQLPTEHTVGTVVYHHCCSFCHRTFGTKTSHAEANCRKKQEADNKRAKNSDVGAGNKKISPHQSACCRRTHNKQHHTL